MFQGIARPAARVEAGVTSEFWLGRNRPSDRLIAEGRPDEDLACYEFFVSPRFFETMGTPLLSGCAFEPQDERPADPPNSNVPLAAVIYLTRIEMG